MKIKLLIGFFVLSWLLSTACVSSHRSSGMLYMYRKLYVRAAREFAAWVKEEPTNPEAHHWLAKVYIHLKEYQKAADELVKACSLYGSSLSYGNLITEGEYATLLYVAKQKLEQGQYQKALVYYKCASFINQSDVRPILAIAKIYEIQGQKENALKYIKRAYILDPETTKKQFGSYLK